MAKVTDIYGYQAAPPQPVSAPSSPDKQDGKQPTVKPVGTHAAVSWVGLLIALIALRLVYEFAD